MENNHLTYFKVENFKKFESLEVNDIGQFNLIVGDNNVGKTCLLEALLLEFHAKKTLSTLRYTFLKRKVKINSSVEYQINKEDFNFNFNLIGLSQKDKNKPLIIQKKKTDGLSHKFEIENIKNLNPLEREDIKNFIKQVNLFQYNGINQISNNWLIFKTGTDNKITFLADVTSSYYKDFYGYLEYFPFIKIDDFYEDDMLEFFRKININPDNEEKLLKIINSLFPSIQIKRIIINELFNKEEILQISTFEKVDYHSITNYGDGFIKTFRIILELLLCESKFICIDEIEIGIHHSKMKDFWTNIFKVCKELDVQLFATTHSEECIEAYAEAALELNEKNIRLIRLQENKDKTIKAICYPFESIEYIVESHTEER